MNKKVMFILPILISLHLAVGCGESDDSDGSTGAIAGQLVINEIVADASDGGFDWIELYVTEGSVDLSSYSIVDDKADRDPQSLPDVTLNAGEYLLIQAIDEEDISSVEGYYVTFKLGSDDAVILYNNGVEMDTLDWQEGEAGESFSFGRVTDGSVDTQTLSPTPGTANSAALEVTMAPDDLIVNNDAELRINEIVAKGNDGGHDWVELYVTGTGTVNLSDYTLADDSRIVAALPDQILSSGEYYQIYATTEVIDEPSVAFKLGSSESLSLYLEDDLIDQLDWKKGQALIGYSYGRFPDGSDSTKVLTPSPKTSNQIAGHNGLVISEVVSNNGSDGLDWFELFNNSEAPIALSNYQVIDENDELAPYDLPDVSLLAEESIVVYATDTEISEYYVPFKLGNTDELNLVLNDEIVDFIDWDGSDVPVGFSYGLTYQDDAAKYGWDKDTLAVTQGDLNNGVRVFDKTTVKELRINISTDNWQSILANPLEEEYHETSITFNGVTLDSVAIRTKGGSSLRSVSQSTSDRYSFKVDINEFVDGQKLFGLKKFTLQNSFNDPSYMREVLAYELLDEMGVATPEHAYVNFYVNDELFGLYLMVEAIDGEFLENHFDNANGDLYKPDGTGSDLVWIGDSISSYSGINLQRNEETTDQGAFLNFVEQLGNGSTDVIDVDGLLRYMSVSVALSNLDSYHGPLAHNYYIYEQDNTFSLLPWDFNEAFGSFNMGCRTDVRELTIDEPTDGALSDKPLIANVFASQTHLDAYHEYLWQLIEGPLDPLTFDKRINEIASLISPYVAADPTAFYTVSEFAQNLDSTVGRFFGLTEFIDYRVANIKQQLQGDIPSAGTGNGFCEGGGGAGGPP